MANDDNLNGNGDNYHDMRYPSVNLRIAGVEKAYQSKLL
jgi:hypothetical protein